MSGHRTLRDLRRGSAARPLDILRLAAHYLLRDGWIASPPSRVGEIVRRFGRSDHASTVAGALARARSDLLAPWMTMVHASHVLNAAAYFPGENPEPLKAWEREAGRTSDDITDLFRRAIEPLRATQGAVLDVAV